jgi:hypothetical protein
MTKHFRFTSLILSLALCGISSVGCSAVADSKAAVVSKNTNTQTLTHTKGDKSKLQGRWHTCSPLANGKFYGNTIEFSVRDQQLVYIAASGLVGEYADANCSKPAGNMRAITSMMSFINKIDAVEIKSSNPSSNTKFAGTVEKFSTEQNPSLMHLGFSADFKSLYLSKSGDFESDAMHYEKIDN